MLGLGRYREIETVDIGRAFFVRRKIVVSYWLLAVRRKRYALRAI